MVWRVTHRIAGICWMLSGLAVMFFITYLGFVPLYSAVLLVLLLPAAFPIGKYLSDKDKLKQ